MGVAMMSERAYMRSAELDPTAELDSLEENMVRIAEKWAARR